VSSPATTVATPIAFGHEKHCDAW
jgi:hypothetical protein